MSIHKSFYKNVYLLTQMIPPSKEFHQHFKEGLFDKPNAIGFIHVTYYLLNIYDEERFKKMIIWPLLDKKSEAEYRNAVKEFLIIISKENEDIDFPPILPSNLLTAHGTRFITIMWKLSQVTLRIFLRRRGYSILAAPKSGDSNPLTKILFKNTIANHTGHLVELDNKIQRSQNIATLHAKQVTDSIELIETELYEAKEKLIKIIENIHCAPETKRRLMNLNDTEIFSIWKNNLVCLLNFLKRHLFEVKNIEMMSTKIENLVLGLFSDQRKVLDGKNLLPIDVMKFTELPLDPVAQVALHHLYLDGKLVLNNLFIIFLSLLRHMSSQLKKDKFPNLTESNEQINVSIEDFKIMSNIIETLGEQLKELSNNIWRCDPVYTQSSMTIDSYMKQDEKVVNSALLKSSPTMHLNIQKEYDDGLDSLERLKLTPIESFHRSIFNKYGNKNITNLNILQRPKLTVSRINFDDTVTSNIDKSPLASNKKNSTLNRNTFERSNSESKVGKKFARLFNSNLKKSATQNSFWKVSNASDRCSSGIHNVSEVINANSTNTSFDSSTTNVKPNNKYNNTNSNVNHDNFTINNKCNNDLSTSEKIIFNSTTVTASIELGTINELNEIPSSTNQQPQPSKSKESNRRHSLKELVDRYNKIKESSLRIPEFIIDDSSIV